MTWKNNFWYTKVKDDGEPCSDEELISNDESTKYNQFVFFLHFQAC
jgi:hypothetical protein